MRARRLLLLIAAVVVSVGFGLRPAQAECVEVTFELHHDDPAQQTTYPLGTPAYCVTPTPWNQAQPLHAGHDEDVPVYPGTPRGFFLQVWLTFP